MLLAAPFLARMLADALERGGKLAQPRHGKPTELALRAAHVGLALCEGDADASLVAPFGGFFAFVFAFYFFGALRAAPSCCVDAPAAWLERMPDARPATYQ